MLHEMGHSASYYSDKGKQSLQDGQLDAALRHHLQALAIEEKSNSRDKAIHIGRIYCDIGVVYKSMSNLHKAMEYFESAKDLIEKVSITSIQLIAVYNEIGSIYEVSKSVYII